ncbi:hypothetical protein LTR22_023168 [Elasticomyces elasticus]|nr:hypothetical protein LTR22_023168 [Elasticomyces elasticus]
MNGSFNGYTGYGHGQQQQNQQNQQQQPQQGLGTFGNLSGQNHQQVSPSHTLPPLQSQHNGGQSGSLSFAHPGSNEHMSTTPHTPSSMSQSATSANSTMSPAHQGNMLPPSSYDQPHGVTQSMPCPSATATSIPGILPQNSRPCLRPKPPGGVSGPMPGFPSMMSTEQLGQQAAFMQDSDAPKHVLGSQGRRGVLPSAPGTTNPRSMIPQKDADGKHLCPHCNKTYLHAKHLKRHLLRHTGDRPYMCHLCKDTFSRSDTLKRHFQKCSIRRGNPTGANHLAHQRRKGNGADRLSASQQDGLIRLADLAEVAGTNAAYPAIVTSSPTVNGDVSGRPSLANTVSTVGTMSHRNSIAGLGILTSNPLSGDQMVTAGYRRTGPDNTSRESSTGQKSARKQDYMLALMIERIQLERPRPSERMHGPYARSWVVERLGKTKLSKRCLNAMQSGFQIDYRRP